MSSHADDTDLDALAAQVRTYPVLSTEQVSDLVAEARRNPKSEAQQTLIEHNLKHALSASLARKGKGLDVADLYQEATVAVVLSVSQFVGNDGEAGLLEDKVTSDINRHLDKTLSDHAALQETEQAVIRETQLLSAVRVRLREELSAVPTTAQLAAILGWTEERVEVVAELLETAGQLHDSELVEYLDDE